MTPPLPSPADRLRALADGLCAAPHRVAGIPAGIISADDFDVTDEAFAALALAPDLARWAADAADALNTCSRCRAGRLRLAAHGSNPPVHPPGDPCYLTNRDHALLARLDALTTGEQK